MKIQKRTLRQFLEEKENISKSDFLVLQELNNSEGDFFELDPNKASRDLLQFIIFNDSLLDYETKATLTFDFLKPKENKDAAVDFWNIKIKGLSTIIEIYEKHLKDLEFNLDLKLGDKLVPIKAKIELINASKFEKRRIEISYEIKMMNTSSRIGFKIFSDSILFLKGRNKDFTFGFLLEEINLFPQKCSLVEYNNLLQKAQE